MTNGIENGIITSREKNLTIINSHSYPTNGQEYHLRSRLMISRYQFVTLYHLFPAPKKY